MSQGAQNSNTSSLSLMQEASKELYCRLCLSTSETNNFRDLFSEFNSNSSIAEVVEDFANIAIFEEDKLSKLICLGCFQKLNAAEDFKSQIETVNYRLKAKLNTNNFVEVSGVRSKQVGDQENENDKSDFESKTRNSAVLIKQEPLTLINYVNDKIVRAQDVFDCVNIKAECRNDDDDDDDVEDSCKNGSFEAQDMEVEQIKKKYKKKKLLLKCELCSKTFTNYEGHRAHSFSHSGLYPYHCSICQRGFGYKATCEAHEATHSDDTPHQCEVCGKRFKTFPGLANHRVVHSETLLKCDQCEKSFKRKDALKEHRKLHSNETPFECELCHRMFKSISQRRYHHQNAHKPIRKAPCQICGKLVPRLASHIKSHTKPFKCTICNLSFGAKRILSNHMTTHTEERLYSCEICQKTFKHSASLQTHQRVHDEEKRFSCDLCDKKFNYKHLLQAHSKKCTKQLL